MGALEGRSILVTGAGVGLGRAYALHAAAEGAAVVVNDIDAANAASTAAAISQIGGTAVVSAGSVASWEAARSAVATCVEAFGTIDGLVNNAGVIRPAKPWEATEQDIRLMVETNLMGAMFVGIHALKVMVAQGFGAVVNNTSAAQLGLPDMSIYGATKGGLASLTYSWALDLAGSGVRVNAYSPVALTGMLGASPLGARAVPSPADNAPVVSFLLSDAASGVNGQVVQRRDDRLVIMRHPDLTEHSATPSEWSIEAVSRALTPVLQKAAQPVGDPRVRAGV